MASDDELDSSGSDFEDVQISEKDMTTLMALEQQLETSASSYDTHLQYIELLRRSKLTAKLRAAHMQSLYKKATKDYLSVAIWESYLGYEAATLPKEESTLTSADCSFEEVAEEAITAAGLHPAEGHKIWDTVRTYYEERDAEGSVTATLHETVESFFHRQLQVPLLDGPSTLAYYKEWAHSDPPASVQAGYDKAQAVAAARKDLEIAVAAGKPADMDLLASYMAYVKLEQAQGDPARVQMAYERAVAVFPVTHFLWSQYARYMEQYLGRLPSLVHAVYQRALRNCPWVGSLWAGALRAAERLGSSTEAQDSLYNQALQAGMQSQEDYMEVVMAKVDAVRRQVTGPEGMPALREAFDAAASLMQSYFPGFLDPALRIVAYRADCEVRLGKDIKAARSIWEAALKTPASRLVETWAGYIAMEVRKGNVREARSLYKRCYAKQLQDTGQLSLCQAWQRFEREHGSPDDHFQACLKTEPLLSKAAAEADAQLAAAAAESAARAPKPQLSKEEMAVKRKEHDPTFKSKAAKKPAAVAAATATAPAVAPTQSDNKRKAADEAPVSLDMDEAAADLAAEPAAKKARTDQAFSEVAAAPPGTQATLRGNASSEAMAGDHQATDAQAADGHDALPVQESEVCYTAFIKHLKESVDEAVLHKLFEGCGEIKSLKIGREAETKRSRGFANVDFATKEALQKAVAMDGVELEGKHLVITVSRGQGRGGTRGRGRGPVGGRGGEEAPGRGQQQQQQHQGSQPGFRQQTANSMADRGRGRDNRGRGGRDSRGSGREGRGRPGPMPARMQGRGRHGEADESHARRAQQQIDLNASAASATMFKPRNVAAAPGGQQSETPKSNADFRQMLMGGKK
ncbi:hypothetical protein WJX74_009405 [Apatococcus lobatus]|uniref:RRM domain-containing protein n=1 Tax=Apatococcus lobatus TaxID=904363 RepID=A0AAW1S6R2_9CHLO